MKKTVTLSNLEIMNAAAALVQLSQCPMAIKPGFSLAKNRKVLETHVATYQEFRQGILKKYAELDGRGEVKVNDDNLVVFATSENEQLALTDIAELNAIASSVEIQTIDVDSVGSIQVSPAVVAALMWMFDEE